MSEIVKKHYGGWISASCGEGESLVLSTQDDPLVEIVSDDISEHGDYLTVRYFVSDCKCGLQDAIINWQRTVMGLGDAEYRVHYSDITGYLWTDEDLTVGGHDLIEELSSFVGKYLILEIEYSKRPGGDL